MRQRDLGTHFTREDARSFLVSRAQGEGQRDLVGRPRVKPSGWTLRARQLERPGLSGDDAALQERTSRRVWCGCGCVGGVRGGAMMRALWTGRCGAAERVRRPKRGAAERARRPKPLEVWPRELVEFEGSRARAGRGDRSHGVWHKRGRQESARRARSRVGDRERRDVGRDHRRDGYADAEERRDFIPRVVNISAETSRRPGQFGDASSLSPCAAADACAYAPAICWL